MDRSSKEMSIRGVSELLCSTDTFEISRQEIDEAVARLGSASSARRALKTRRNTFTHINRLPTEILSEIFLWSRIGTFYPIFTPPPKLSRWIRITHVCRHWRDVALDCPRLWNTIVPNNPNWTREWLIRSKEAPLSISFAPTGPDETAQHAMELVLAHMTRIATLHIYTDLERMGRLLDATTPGPILERLTLRVRGYPETDEDIQGYTLPELFCTSAIPTLKKLDLACASFRWDSPIVTHLTVLALKVIPPASRPSLREMLDMLARASSLTVLILGEDVVDLGGTNPSLDVVNLPRLGSISLSMQARVCGALLTHLTFPSSATIRLECICEESAYTDLTEITPRLKTSSASGSGLQSLRITGVTSWLASSFYGFSFVGSQNNVENIDVSLMWPSLEIPSSSIVMRMVAEICKGLSLAHLQTLYVGDADITEANWLDLFGSCANLSTVAVSSTAYSAREFIFASASDSTANDAPMFLPALQHVELQDISFEGDNHPGDSRLANELYHSLKSRLDGGVGLHSLVLSECPGLDQVHVDRLKTVAFDVDWDGFTGGGVHQ
ncbi:hypothetical protein PLICRDRAFT_93441 [Plicaturopsis crispa FD-325 SS-3]|nr:hypothetical protein PLICRDRAFT_93441 [Plicaturopsis crispa FD-325 SS-3]